MTTDTNKIEGGFQERIENLRAWQIEQTQAQQARINAGGLYFEAVAKEKVARKRVPDDMQWQKIMDVFEHQHELNRINRQLMLWQEMAK